MGTFDVTLLPTCGCLIDWLTWLTLIFVCIVCPVAWLIDWLFVRAWLLDWLIRMIQLIACYELLYRTLLLDWIGTELEPADYFIEFMGVVSVQNCSRWPDDFAPIPVFRYRLKGVWRLSHIFSLRFSRLTDEIFWVKFLLIGGSSSLFSAKKQKGFLRAGLKDVSTRIRKGDRGCANFHTLWHCYDNSICIGLFFRLHRIVILAGDAQPIDCMCHLPCVCEELNIPYCYTPSRQVRWNISSQTSELDQMRNQQNFKNIGFSSVRKHILPRSIDRLIDWLNT